MTLLNFSEVYPDEESCVENLRRFLAGQPLLNQVDRSTGYVD